MNIVLSQAEEDNEMDDNDEEESFDRNAATYVCSLEYSVLLSDICLSLSPSPKKFTRAVVSDDQDSGESEVDNDDESAKSPVPKRYAFFFFFLNYYYLASTNCTVCLVMNLRERRGLSCRPLMNCLKMNSTRMRPMSCESLNKSSINALY